MNNLRVGDKIVFGTPSTRCKGRITKVNRLTYGVTSLTSRGYGRRKRPAGAKYRVSKSLCNLDLNPDSPNIISIGRVPMTADCYECGFTIVERGLVTTQSDIKDGWPERKSICQDCVRDKMRNTRSPLDTTRLGRWQQV